MALQKYHVILDALVMRIGKEKDDVRQFLHGAVLELDDAATSTKTLLASRSISLKSRDEALTVKQVVPAYGAADDPVQAPSQDVQPVEDTTVADSTVNQADTGAPAAS